MKYHHVYVPYPQGLQTGGPEALHQLVSVLTAVGQPASLVPWDGTGDAPRVPDYDHYGCDVRASVDDSPGNAVVMAESWFADLRRFRQADRYLWWLSVDNSRILGADRLLHNGEISLRQPRTMARVALQAARRRQPYLSDITHLAQSRYAWSQVYARIGQLPSLLGDFVAPVACRFPEPTRPRVVAFNPKKGRQRLEAVVSAAPDIEFAPIEGLDRQGVQDLLARTSVYLDLGQHPGKDRLPREAAAAGAVVVVGRRGAAAFDQDVPIPSRYKIHPDEPAGRIADLLRDTLQEPAEHWAAQSRYHQTISGERTEFARQVRDVFVDGRLGQDV